MRLHYYLPTLALAGTAFTCKCTAVHTVQASSRRRLRLLLLVIILLVPLSSATSPAAAAAASPQYTPVQARPIFASDDDAASSSSTSRRGPLRRKRTSRRQVREVDRKVSRSEHVRQHTTSTTNTSKDEKRPDKTGSPTINYMYAQDQTEEMLGKVATLHFYSKQGNQPLIQNGDHGQYNYASYTDNRSDMDAAVVEKQTLIAKLQFYPKYEDHYQPPPPQPKQQTEEEPLAYLTFYLDTADDARAGAYGGGDTKTDSNAEIPMGRSSGNLGDSNEKDLPQSNHVNGAKKKGEGLLAWFAKQQHQTVDGVEPTMSAPTSTMVPTAAPTPPPPTPTPTSSEPTSWPTSEPTLSIASEPPSHVAMTDGDLQNIMGDTNAPVHDAVAGEDSIVAEPEVPGVVPKAAAEEGESGSGPIQQSSPYQPSKESATDYPLDSPVTFSPTVSPPPEAAPTPTSKDTAGRNRTAAPTASPGSESESGNASSPSASYYYYDTSSSGSYSYEYYSYSMSMSVPMYAANTAESGVSRNKAIDNRYGNRYDHRADSKSYAQRERRRLGRQKNQRQNQRQRQRRRRRRRNLRRTYR